MDVDASFCLCGRLFLRRLGGVGKKEFTSLDAIDTTPSKNPMKYCSIIHDSFVQSAHYEMRDEDKKAVPNVSYRKCYVGLYLFKQTPLSSSTSIKKTLN